MGGGVAWEGVGGRGYRLGWCCRVNSWPSSSPRSHKTGFNTSGMRRRMKNKKKYNQEK